MATTIRELAVMNTSTTQLYRMVLPHTKGLYTLSQVHPEAQLLCDSSCCHDDHINHCICQACCESWGTVMSKLDPDACALDLCADLKTKIKGVGEGTGIDISSKLSEVTTLRRGILSWVRPQYQRMGLDLEGHIGSTC